MVGLSKHNESLDGLRGVAALLVVLYHMDAFVGVAASDTGLYTQQTLVWQVFRRLIDGNFSVALFFVLSGYVLVSGVGKGEDYLRYAFIKRYFRLTPMVLASVLFACILSISVGFHNVEAANNMGGHIWLSSQYVDPLSFLGAIQNGLWGAYAGDVSYNGPLWTIRLELIGSFVLIGFSALFYRARLFAFYSVVFSGFLVIVFGVDGVYVSLFLMGAVLHKVGSFRLRSWWVFLVFPLATENPWTTEMLFLKDVLPVVDGLDVCCHAVAAVMLLSIVLGGGGWFSGRWVVLLGKLSFALYAVHIPVMLSVGALVFNFGCGKGECQIYSVYSIVVTLVASFFAAAVLYFLVDKRSQNFANWVVALLRRVESRI